MKKYLLISILMLLPVYTYVCSESSNNYFFKCKLIDNSVKEEPELTEIDYIKIEDTWYMKGNAGMTELYPYMSDGSSRITFIELIERESSISITTINLITGIIWWSKHTFVQVQAIGKCEVEDFIE